MDARLWMQTGASRPAGSAMWRMWKVELEVVVFHPVRVIQVQRVTCTIFWRNCSRAVEPALPPQPGSANRTTPPGAVDWS